jgi:Domain of unknown function (DUF5615)
LNDEIEGQWPQFRFLMDHNVPDSVGNKLVALGQDVVRLRDIMAVDTKDPIVATAAMESSRILVSWDRDFKEQRFKGLRYAQLSRLSMSGPEMYGANRLETVFDIVIFALQRANGSPLTIAVGAARVQILV